MTRFNSRWHEILFKFPKFSRFFTNFRGFSWISAVVTSGVLKTGSNLTPLDAIHTETEHNQYKYLWIPHFSLSFSLSTMWKRRGSDRERAVLHNNQYKFQLVLALILIISKADMVIIYLSAKLANYSKILSSICVCVRGVCVCLCVCY